MKVSTSRSGIAMILVLLAVLVLSGAGLTLVRTSASFSNLARHELFERRSRITANDLREVLVAWVDQRSSSGGKQSGTEELQLSIDGCDIEVETVDLAGCLHAKYLAGASSLLYSLPSEFHTLSIPKAYASLDWEKAIPEERPTLEELSSSNSFYIWGTQGDARSPRLCQWITTAGRGSLNIHTAPLDLLSAAMTAAEVEASDARRVIKARSENHAIDPTVAARAVIVAQQAHRTNGKVIPLTTREGPWGFLVTVKEDRQQARWWVEVEEVRAKHTSTPRHRWKVTQFRRVP